MWESSSQRGESGVDGDSEVGVVMMEDLEAVTTYSTSWCSACLNVCDGEKRGRGMPIYGGRVLTHREFQSMTTCWYAICCTDWVAGKMRVVCQVVYVQGWVGKSQP